MYHLVHHLCIVWALSAECFALQGLSRIAPPGPESLKVLLSGLLWKCLQSLA